MKKTILAYITLFVLLFAILPLEVVKAAAPTTQTTISVKKTGSEPFDGQSWTPGNLATAGLDQDENNNIVRLQDSITYQVELSANDASINNLVATVVLDKKQAWIEIPTGCKTDAAEVNPVSNISADKRILVCNTGFAIEGTNKIIFPTARAIGASSDGTEITLNDDRISASVSVQGDGSNISSDTSEETIVTANFKVDTYKELKVTALDPDTNEPLYRAPAKKGPANELGSLMEYVIKSKYIQGSMIADAPNEANGDFEVDYVLYDYYTDNNTNNDGSGFSTNAKLYTWDASQPACELVGDHGANASVTCTQVDHPVDQLGAAYAADGINDRNIKIELFNIDVRDPDADGNLIEVKINIWNDRTLDIQSHQNCQGGGGVVCTTTTINSVGVYDAGTTSFKGFNPVSTEDASGNNLLNYNGAGEPFPQYVTYDLSYISPGSWSTVKSFYGVSWGTNTKGPEQKAALGDTIPFFINVYDYRKIDGAKTQVCDNIDITQFEYAGLSAPNRNDMGYGFNHAPTNPNVVVWGGTISNTGHSHDTNGFSTLLFSDRVHANLTELRDHTCNDDLNADGKYIIDGINQATGLADAPNDWVSDPASLGGNANVTTFRHETIYNQAYINSIDPSHTSYSVATNYLLKIKTTATGYGPSPTGNMYLPNFMHARRDNGDNNFTAWNNNSTIPIDVNNVNFSYKWSYADRMTLVPSSHSIEKYTSPKGLKVVRGGDVVDFIIEPKLFGLWAVAINTASVRDTIPAGTAYILGSEKFSTDGGVTWLNFNNYMASNPDITLSGVTNTNQQSLAWNFTSVDAGEQLPLIKYSVQVDINRVSGVFTNTASIYSDIGVDDDGDGTSDAKYAKYQLTILPEYGFDVFKKNQQDVYGVNTPFTFELIYKNLGGENYAKGDFIDILPFNGDTVNNIGGINSSRTPATAIDGIYKVTKLVGTNSEAFYATADASTSIKSDPCHEDNSPAGYVPVVGDICYNAYVNNGNKFAGGGVTGTAVTNWVACTGTNPVVCGALDTKDITAIRFTTNSVPSSGGKKVEIELTPEGNKGGVPNIDALSNVTSASTGNIYTNTFSGRVPEISLLVISNDASVTMVSGSIGDKVFLDVDNSGSETAGDTPITNVKLSILDVNGDPVYKDPVTGAIVSSTYPGAVVYTTTTDNNGNYLFDNLPSGDYTVVVDQTTLPSSVVQTYDPDATLDSKSTHSLTAQTNVFGEIQDIENNTTQDFGYMPLSSLGDTVWIDSNADGIQDAGELGFSGATLNLLDAGGNIVATTTTDANGNYLFENLQPGDYKVEFVLPADYILSENTQGGDIAKDSDFLANLKTDTISLGTNEHRTDIDAGIYKQAHIGDKVWFDTDKDGVQDAGEAGIGGVVVNLLDENGQVVATTTTGGNGEYGFDVKPGTYSVEFVKPAGYVGSPKGAGADDVDSNADKITGKTDPIVVKSGDNITTIDAGMYVPTASVGDRVWIDSNADGIQDAGEQGQGGITVELLSTTGVVIATTTTDANGNYLFEDVVAGDYKIKFSGLPEDFKFSPQNAGGDANDSNADIATGETAVFTLNDNDSILTIDAGIHTTASLGDTVWNDIDKDGEQDAGESGVKGVVVNLLDENGQQVATTTTDANGKYIFENLEPNKYIVEFIKPNGYVSSPKENIVDTNSDSNADIATGKTSVITLKSGDVLTDIDAGIYIPTGSVGDKVWIDTNGDGKQDAGEVGIEGIKVELLSTTGAVIATTTTDANGNYLFEDVVAGDYKVKFSDIPNKYVFSPKNAANGNLDSNVNITTGETDVFTLHDREDIRDIDAGIVELGSISGKVVHDKNRGGTQDAGDENLSGVTIKLLDATGNVIATTTTNSAGEYKFENLIAADYKVEIVRPSEFNTDSVSNVGSDRSLDFDIIEGGKTGVISLGVGENKEHVDAGFYKRGGSSSSRRSAPRSPKKKVVKKKELKKEVVKKKEPKKEVVKKEEEEEEEVLDFSVLERDYKVYTRKREQLQQIIKNEGIQGLGLEVLPRVLPKTGTPIGERIKTIKQSKVATDLPISDLFRLAGNTRSDLDFWKQVLPEEDKNRDEYIVIPSNGLVVPINNVPKDTADFTKMVSGNEIHVNDYLKTGVMAYPESSKNGYGEVGNKVVFGHSSYWKKDDGRYKTHFQKIIEMNTGEEVWVYKKINGEFKRFRYLVEKSYNTPQSDTSVLTAGVGSNLTLFTCTPIGGIRGRWIIKAKYISEDKTQLQKEIKGLDVAFKYKLFVDRFIDKISKYKGERKKKVILKIYSRIVTIEKKQKAQKILDILQYMKIRLLIEFFE